MTIQMDLDNLAVEYPGHPFLLPEELPGEEDTSLKDVINSKDQNNNLEEEEEEENDEKDDDRRPQHLTLITSYTNVNIIYGSPPGTSPPTPSSSSGPVPSSFDASDGKENAPSGTPDPSSKKGVTSPFITKKQAAILAGVAVGTGVAAVVAAPLVLAAAGFGSGGIIAGSAAALWQSSIGNVVAGSFFASLQSAGAAGLAASTSACIGAVGSLLGGGAAGAAVALSNATKASTGTGECLGPLDTPKSNSKE